MKILLIEDTEFKIEKIVEYLRTCGHPDINIKKSYNAVLKEIDSINFSADLILLDISIPVFDVPDGSSEFMPSGGKAIYNQLYMNGIDAKVIVITLYKSFDDGSLIENLNKLFNEEYPETYLGYIVFNSNDIKWQADLNKFLTNNQW
ncbi:MULTISPECIES: response regulator transcription factor [Niastella]|uniref:Response regulator transcription factor n=1 Tax=Niastella soli TaxID=2821487 RepID=A0ABS3Z4P4_9BACT|nr:response regulator transcription factor [Niastella soli]MBO9204625.1 response regulator transcription factor [Niastella soli]